MASAMRKSRLAVIALVMLVLAPSVRMFWPKADATHHSKLVTLRYAARGADRGSAPGELAFWVTNHTRKKLCIIPLEIEVQTPSGWTTYSQVSPLRALFFSTNASSRDVLGPGEAGYGRIPAQNLTLPTNTVWRLKSLVGDRWEGIDRLKAIPAIPAWLRYQRSTGKKVDIRSANPFRGVITQPLEHVLSEEVAPQ